MDRRRFIERFGITAAGVGLAGNAALENVLAASAKTSGLSPEQAAEDETLWREVQNAFSVNRNLINLDNGNVCPSPKNVTEAVIRQIWRIQDAPGLMLWEFLEPQLKTVAHKLAATFGGAPDELALVRNATEGLHAVLLGLRLDRGDEILMTSHDYWAVHDAAEERSRRDGIIVRKIDTVPMPAASMSQLTEMYERAITPKTKLLVLTNPVNYTGQFFPVKEICGLAHSRGVEVLVDGAQSFAHTDYRIPDLGCDYFAASLHKWLLAPLGTGLLYIKRDKIEKVRSLLPGTNFDEERKPDEIFRFDNVGTQSFAANLGITEAVEFHNGIGGKRKEARLRYLTKYWVDRVRSLPKMKFHTSFEPGMSCGLVTFEIEGISSPDLARHLFREHFILVQNVRSRRAPEIRGVRVTPNVYTTLRELDFFCEKIEHIARRGLPS